MKIAFDISPLQSGHAKRGIGFYTERLLTELKKDADLEIYEFSNLSEVKNADVVHYPYFDLFKHTLPVIKKFPTVVTIHDVIPLLFPKNYPPGIKGFINNQLQKISIKNCAEIITDSLSSQQDISRIFDITKSKITPIYLAPSENFQKIKKQSVLKDIKNKYNLPDRFALYTGNVNWNKNIINMTKACEQAGIDLVFVGDGFDQENLDHPELKEYKTFIDLYSAKKFVHILGYISKQDLVVIMNLADMLLLPSFYEGFGLPILEAQICEVPVITSNISSMIEIAADSAILVNPYDIDSLVKEIKKLSSDNKLRQKIIAKGLKNVKQYSWKTVEQQTANVYKKIYKK